jgi:hypothetical protein
MKAATDRRAVLGTILTAGACLSLPSWAGASAFGRRSYPGGHRAPPAGLRRIHGGSWGQTPVLALHDRAKADEGAASELRRFRELETEEDPAGVNEPAATGVTPTPDELIVNLPRSVRSHSGRRRPRGASRDHSGPSGSNLTFESGIGFPRWIGRASLRDARWKIALRFVRRYSPAQSCGARPQRAAEARLAS